MKKKIENNVAEIIITAIFIMFMVSSCGSTYGTCPAYSNHNVNTTVNG